MSEIHDTLETAVEQIEDHDDLEFADGYASVLKSVADVIEQDEAGELESERDLFSAFAGMEPDAPFMDELFGGNNE